MPPDLDKVELRPRVSIVIVARALARSRSAAGDQFPSRFLGQSMRGLGRIFRQSAQSRYRTSVAFGFGVASAPGMRLHRPPTILATLVVKQVNRILQRQQARAPA